VTEGTRRRVSWWRWGWAALLGVVALGGFCYPGSVIVRCIFDGTLRRGGISPLAVSWHRALTPRYEKWARARVASGKAQHLALGNVSGTEWPLFGSAFYLWATEAIQEGWEKDARRSAIEPRESARGAVEAAVDLVIDPNHAGWVKRHWGDRYLETENAFYRMLLISAMTSAGNLTGSKAHDEFLRNQADSLAREIDGSRAGLLDDYPGQCYPTDIIAAIAAIRRSDARTQSDHTAFAQRALRGFDGPLLDPIGLPAYSSHAPTGMPTQPARGCGISYSILRAREVWPERAAQWYATYETHFWQEDWLTSGFREFSRETPGRDWYFDVDSGPVLRGIGFAASAFGVATARAQGRYDHAYPLTLQMIALSWPLPTGRLLVPMALSNLDDAPMLGEAAILFALTQPGTPVVEPSRWAIPGLVWLCLAFYFGTGLVLLRFAWRVVRVRG
jgi:hypothetical protein